MKNKNVFVLVFSIVMLLVSCSKEESNTESILIGDWRLTGYDIGVEVDVNKDDHFNLNLLDELDCLNNEVLTFESNGVVASTDTFNPIMEISRSSLGEYSFDVECVDGIIGLATSYTFDGNSVIYSNRTSVLSGNILTRVIEDVIEVYNEDLSAVIETRDLTLIYTKD